MRSGLSDTWLPGHCAAKCFSWGILCGVGVMAEEASISKCVKADLGFQVQVS